MQTVQEWKGVANAALENVGSGIRDARRERERESAAGEREGQATCCAESAAVRERAREREGGPLLPVLPYLPGFCSGRDGHRAA